MFGWELKNSNQQRETGNQQLKNPRILGIFGLFGGLTRDTIVAR